MSASGRDSTQSNRSDDGSDKLLERNAYLGYRSESEKLYNVHTGIGLDVHIIKDLIGERAHEQNAFQRVADVAVQKSLREGFGLVVSEALWKETPVVGGNTGGIRLQLKDGMGGFLVSSVPKAAERIEFSLTHAEEAGAMARRSRGICPPELFVASIALG